MSRILNTDSAVYAALVTIAVNAGSAMTPIGNPQNVIIWQHYRVPFHVFTGSLAPFTLISMLVLLAYSQAIASRSRSAGPATAPPSVKVNKVLVSASLTLLILDVVLAQYGLALLAAAITVVTLILIRSEVVTGADYPLMAIFILMFADFRGLAHLAASAFAGVSICGPLAGILVPAVLSQVVSNVPATLLLIGHVSSWSALAVGANLGGVGTVTGSLANVIALRLAGMSAKEFHKITLPYFALLTVVLSLLAAAGLYPH